MNDYTGATITVDDYLRSIGILTHYGTPRHSGRYPWGSGGDENGSQRNKSFLGTIADMKRQGLSETDIAKGVGMTTTQLRTAKSIAKNQQKQADITMAVRLKDKGMSNVAIGERLNMPESSVRALLADSVKDKADILNSTANMLRERVDTGAYIDVGTGVEHHLAGVSRQKLDTAIALLEQEGYSVIKVQVDQIGTQNKTTIKVVAPPGTIYKDIVTNKENIEQVNAFSEDGGRTFLGIKTPLNISSKRVGINYDEDGGSLADGVIYVRPGVKDISIGNARYAQVRIAVDGSHYLKGMAVYKDDLPKGVDLLFNTNKSRADIGGNKLDAMKAMKDDPDNPFGATIRQIVDAKTGKVTSAMNIVGHKEGSGEEGSWDTWSKNLPSQFLSKQSPTLAKQQLDMTFERKRRELDEINALTNPTVRKKMLEAYADGADSSSVHLKAAALPRQSTHVILPINSLKDTEVYAPNFKNGERVALVRFPHGGTFEIPELTVNNNHAPAKKLLGRAKDAIGINARVAERLSGADFDGDTVLVIPNNKGRVKSSSPLAGLKNFDPKRSYAPYDGMKTMDGGIYNAKTKKSEFTDGKKPSSRTKGFEMGDVSNLITDMTIGGASSSELARAVRHSMVVIDAEKHYLNWRQSANDNNIKQLKEKYQGGANKGAATLVSRATARADVNARKPRAASQGGPIDKKTGKKVYVETGESWVDSKGKTVYKTQRSTKMAEASDARTLIGKGNTRIESIYAEHSNKLKSLANEARKSAVNTKTAPHSLSAKKVYDSEVKSLSSKLVLAQKNRPLERQAQVIAGAVVRAKQQSNPNVDSAELKKIRYQALTEARIRTGASKNLIHITDTEWAAIQAGAITQSKLKDILDNADLDRVRALATPKAQVLMTPTKSRRAESMARLGYTQAEIADALGVSVTTLKRSLNE